MPKSFCMSFIFVQISPVYFIIQRSTPAFLYPSADIRYVLYIQNIFNQLINDSQTLFPFFFFFFFFFEFTLFNLIFCFSLTLFTFSSCSHIFFLPINHINPNQAGLLEGSFSWEGGVNLTPLPLPPPLPSYFKKNLSNFNKTLFYC